jgi:hypothetical protein
MTIADTMLADLDTTCVVAAVLVVVRETVHVVRLSLTIHIARVCLSLQIILI